MLGEKKHVKVHHKGWCQVWNVGIQLKDISNMYMYNIIRQSWIYIYICIITYSYIKPILFMNICFSYIIKFFIEIINTNLLCHYFWEERKKSYQGRLFTEFYLCISFLLEKNCIWILSIPNFRIWERGILCISF